VPDYSEFPTTPTAWQEVHAADWAPVSALDTQDAAPPPRGIDRVALVPGLAFVVLAIAFMAGAGLPDGVFGDGGFLWLVLIIAGVALLAGELRKARRRR
jgi:hypothetical protein